MTPHFFGSHGTKLQGVYDFSRGVKLGEKLSEGSQEKYMSRVGKKSEGVRKIPIFVWGGHRNFLPPPLCVGHNESIEFNTSYWNDTFVTPSICSNRNGLFEIHENQLGLFHWKRGWGEGSFCFQIPKDKGDSQFFSKTKTPPSLFFLHITSGCSFYEHNYIKYSYGTL